MRLITKARTKKKPTCKLFPTCRYFTNTCNSFLHPQKRKKSVNNNKKVVAIQTFCRLRKPAFQVPSHGPTDFRLGFLFLLSSFFVFFFYYSLLIPLSLMIILFYILQAPPPPPSLARPGVVGSFKKERIRKKEKKGDRHGKKQSWWNTVFRGPLA